MTGAVREVIPNCPVEAAIAYADDPVHQGAGYWLMLTLRAGGTVRGAVVWCRRGVVRLDCPNGTNSDEPPVFVRCADVMTARVEW